MIIFVVIIIIYTTMAKLNALISIIFIPSPPRHSDHRDTQIDDNCDGNGNWYHCVDPGHINAFLKGEYHNVFIPP